MKVAVVYDFVATCYNSHIGDAYLDAQAQHALTRLFRQHFKASLHLGHRPFAGEQRMVEHVELALHVNWLPIITNTQGRLAGSFRKRPLQ